MIFIRSGGGDFRADTDLTGDKYHQINVYYKRRKEYFLMKVIKEHL